MISLKNLIRAIRYVKNRNLSAIEAWRLAHDYHRSEIHLHPKLIDRKIVLRGGESSDIDVFDQIFVQRSYAIPDLGGVQYIIDAGANFGASTMFFSHFCPKAKIAAIEPSGENMALLSRNCADLPNVTLFRNGLFSRSAPLRIANPDCKRHWAYQVEECPEEDSDFLGISVDGIFERMSFPHVDLFKIDIEGAELELFSENYETWINRVNIFIVEIHDFMRPDCGRAFMSALLKMDAFNMSISGENLVIQRRNPLR